MAQTDEFGKHEVLHTASIIMDNWDTYVADHAITQLDPDLSVKAKAISEALYDFYQACGAKFL